MLLGGFWVLNLLTTLGYVQSNFTYEKLNGIGRYPLLYGKKIQIDRVL